MLFIENKYTHWYYSIIANAQQQNRKKLKRNQIGYVYYEKHHIIPTSLGGPDNINNWANLTAREHFICHWLLTKCTNGIDKSKMICALHRMQGKNKSQQRYNTKITARVYENIRNAHAQIMSRFNQGKTSWNNGIPMSSETKAKMIASKSGYITSEETKSRISAKLKGKSKPPRSDQWRIKQSLAQTGKVLSTAHIAILKQPKPTTICPHCGKIGAGNAMKQWHFDKCKQLNTIL